MELDRERKIARRGNGDLPNDSNLARSLTWFGQHALNDGPQMADPRRYLYVQMNLRNADQNPVAARITLKNGTTTVSDFGFKDVAIGRNGWSQTSILLPAATKPSDLGKLEFVARGGNGTPTVAGLGHIYMLDQNYVPTDVTVPIQSKIANEPDAH